MMVLPHIHPTTASDFLYADAFIFLISFLEVTADCNPPLLRSEIINRRDEK